jgi:hypothetical protein
VVDEGKSPAMDDDIEFEVTDLHTGAPIRHPLAHTGSDPNTPNQPERRNDEQSPLPGRRHGANWLRAAIVAVGITIAVILVVLVNPAAKSSLYTVFRLPTPVPSPTPLPGGNTVYLVRGAPWAAVTIDGKLATNLSLGMTLSWIKLAAGRHTIVVAQQPFPTLRCVVSMPASPRDTCPLITPSTDTPEFGNAGSADLPAGSRVVDLGARFSRLPQDARDALVTAVNAKLTYPPTPITMQPGDHYLREDGTLAVAQTGLRATFVPTLLAPINAVASDSNSCVSFCDVSGTGMSSSGTWNMIISLVGTWHITSFGGAVVVDSAPMFPAEAIYEGQPPTLTAEINLLWTGQWQVSAQNGFNGSFSPICQTADNLVNANLNAGSNAGSQVSVTGMGYQAAHTPEQGCVVTMMLSDSTASDPLYAYYHLGVLLAANGAAHQAFPALPVASANERALALQVLANP